MPYSFESGQLDFIDMDIDVIVWPDGTLQVVDLDEFEKNKVKYQYPENVVATAKQTLGEITNDFPRRRSSLQTGSKQSLTNSYLVLYHIILVGSARYNYRC